MAEYKLTSSLSNTDTASLSHSGQAVTVDVGESLANFARHYATEDNNKQSNIKQTEVKPTR